MREQTKNLFASNLTRISIGPKNSLQDLDEEFFFFFYYRKDEQWNNTKISWKMSSIGNSTILTTNPPRINWSFNLGYNGAKGEWVK